MPVMVVVTENNICRGKCVFRSCYSQCPTIKHLYGRSELSSPELFHDVCWFQFI